MNINQRLAEELKIELWQVEAAVKLIDEGNTIPFISRYRKEVTGSLNDEVLRKLSERLTYLRNLEDKKKQVLASIEEQGKLTDELREKIQAAETLVVVEDLYRPYRPKRRTRAMIAKEKGLEPLANTIDDMVVETVREGYDTAMDLLEKNKMKLHELAKYLYEKETITGEEFMQILNRKEISGEQIRTESED